MRLKVLNFLKRNPLLLQLLWKIAKIILLIASCFIPVKKKTILFCSFGGRKFDDSPKALFDEICNRKEFDDWKLIWAFENANQFYVKRGTSVKIDTVKFLFTLLSSHIWISNSGMDRGINLLRNKFIRIETWHGTPLKKIGGDENKNSMNKFKIKTTKKDSSTIRCAQSQYDREIFARIFNSTLESILVSDLPRNDKLLSYTEEEIITIKHKLGLDFDKKVILYTPTYREYLVDENKNTYLAPPIDFKKWEKRLGNKYVVLVRAHYAVINDLGITSNDFVIDVSQYPVLNDLYIISDFMISDYSSTFFDYAILDRPMFCFAYDYDEYKINRGLYLDLDETLPCRVDHDEDSLLESILNVKVEKASERTRIFHQKYAPNAGHASQIVVDKILDLVKQN